MTKKPAPDISPKPDAGSAPGWGVSFTPTPSPKAKSVSHAMTGGRQRTSRVSAKASRAYPAWRSRRCWTTTS